MNSSALMTRDVVVVAPTVTVGSAATMMKRRHIRHLPVAQLLPFDFTIRIAANDRDTLALAT